MTTEPGHDGETPRRKFDDIASLFGPIVPGTGAPSRFPPHRPAFIPMPPTYTAPVRPPEPNQPQDPAPDLEATDKGTTGEDFVGIVPGLAAPIDARADNMLAQRIEPPPLARPRPAEIPWPDAFEPRPNFRQRERNAWSWLLLIPAGLVAAAAITMVDARSVRTWIDTTILHRTSGANTLDSPLLPLPFRTAPAGNAAPVSAPVSAPATSTPAPAEELIPYPAIPTSPIPVPPGTEVSPPPDQADTAAAATAPIRVTIQFRRNIPGADGEARRIAALLQSYGGSIELHPNTATVKSATINYYNSADKDAATALASVLANEAANWSVRLGTTKNPPGALDVWLP